MLREWSVSPRRAAVVLAVLALLLLPVSALAAPVRPPAAMARPNGGQAFVMTNSESQVVAQGLDNPRHLAFGPEGALYVAESGKGGAGPCYEFEGSQMCYGPSGAITRIDLKKGTQERVATGLPSMGPEGAVGPSDIAFHGRGNGFIVTGLGGNPADRPARGPDGGNFGRLVRMVASGNYTYGADISAFEALANPDGTPGPGGIDSNPYGVLALPDETRLVADAGGNDLLKVDGEGNVSLMAVFPARLADAPPFLGLPPSTQIPMQSVPTSVALGPDGAYYVGELTGFPFPEGGANVFRVDPVTHEVSVFRAGFTQVVDIAFGPDGSLYVAQISNKPLWAGDPWGSIIKVSPDGSTRTEIAAVPLPGGVEVGPDGAVYASIWSVVPTAPDGSGGGMVVRIMP